MLVVMPKTQLQPLSNTELAALTVSYLLKLINKLMLYYFLAMCKTPVCPGPAKRSCFGETEEEREGDGQEGSSLQVLCPEHLQRNG